MKDSALVKLHGMLALMSIVPAPDGIGKCPVCGGTEFRDAPHGWVECDCGFAVLKIHITETKDGC